VVCDVEIEVFSTPSMFKPRGRGERKLAIGEFLRFLSQS
jgi:hypothetical protein